MTKKQAPLGSTKGKRCTRNLSEPAEPTNSQLGGPATEVTNPSDARENLENGSVAGIGRYLRDDVGALLKQIAKPRHQPPQGVRKQQGGDDPDLEFDFGTEDVVAATEGGHSDLVGDYLGELAKLIVRIGDMLDPNGCSEFQLKPARRRRGKPKNQKQAILEGNIHRDLRFARIRLGGKLEAAISEVSKNYGLSRSTVLRICAKRR